MERRPGSAWGRLADSRLLVWMLLWALASGAVLMLWFDEDAARHAASAPRGSAWLRGLHASATLLLVAGTMVHGIMRIRRHRHKARAVMTGGLAVLSVALAAWSGALIAQTVDAAWLLRHLRLQGAVLEVAVVHMAYATLLVAITVYFHLARRRAHRIVGGVGHFVLATGVLLMVTAILGPAHVASRGHLATAIVAPPMPYLWAWTFVVGTAFVAVGLARRNAVQGAGANE